jgi:hypothetical protein
MKKVKFKKFSNLPTGEYFGSVDKHSQEDISLFVQ